jgi:hypothetical protein
MIKEDMMNFVKNQCNRKVTYFPDKKLGIALYLPQS